MLIHIDRSFKYSPKNEANEAFNPLFLAESH